MNCAAHNPPKVYIFDCDGVLIDSWKSAMYFFNLVRQGVGLGPISREEEDFVFAATMMESFERIIPPHLMAKALETAKGVRVEDVLHLVQVHAGAPELLGFLRDHGCRTAVDTNGGEEALPILEHLGLRRLFDQIVTVVDVARPKPDPEGVQLILSRLGAKRTEAVFIGDSDVDRETALAAGVDFWSYRDPRLEAGRHIHDFRELKAELAREFQASARFGLGAP